MLTYSPLQITDSPDKPFPMANQGFPYTSLSDRRFEELIYSIYKLKIDNETDFKNQFDAIMLMQEVGEKGRDCVLFKEGINTGAIQCKKYASRITKPDCAKEIIKFVLYSLTDATLISNINNFTYYFVASGGFSEPAALYLDNFNDEIQKEPDLETWFNDVKRSFQAFKMLNFADISTQLIQRLASIRLIKIIPQELDVEISKPFLKDVVPLFFEVRSVIDTREFGELKEIIQKSITEEEQIRLSFESIQQRFETASLQLITYKDTLYNLPDSHINRTETNEVLNWIYKPLKEKESPILLLVGNPGYGKSVILKNVYQSLSADKIPVLGIKSDRYYSSSIAQLTEQMNMEYSPIKLVKKLKEKYYTIIVLIDQIDSLSQSVTSKRDYIDTYNQLVHDLKQIPGVRIVISIRTFDLNYDYEFSYYRDFSKITVKPLEKQQLKSILDQFGINIERIPLSLEHLLRIPNHLDIFCKIFNPAINLNHINTLHDLYNELWNQKVLSAPNDIKELSKTLFQIADKLYSSQSLHISESQLGVESSRYINHFIRNGLLIRQNGIIQFFHQSFYDYVFSKAFVERKQSLTDFIKKENQSIYIRPGLKMILAFIRRSDAKGYINIIESILFSDRYRFHIQLLIINQLGFEASPLKEEISLVKSKVLTSKIYFIPFLESATGEPWLNIIMGEGALAQLLFPTPTIPERIGKIPWLKSFKNNLPRGIRELNYEKRKETYLNLWFHILRRALPYHRNSILQYLSNLNPFPEKDYAIVRLLLSLKVWDNQMAFKLVERHLTNRNKYWYEFLNILTDAIDHNFDWSLNAFSNYYNQSLQVDADNNSMLVHETEEFFKKMFKLNNEKSFEFGLEVVKQHIKKSISGHITLNAGELYDDFVYDFYQFDKAHISNDKDMVYELVIDAATELAKLRSPVFEKFIQNIEDEDSISILKVALIALKESAGLYASKSFDVLQKIYDKGGFHTSLKFFIRNLISEAYLFFSQDQKHAINEIILQIKADHEIGIVEIKGKKTIYSKYGYLKFEYLSSIPRIEIALNSGLKRVFLELERKFKKAPNPKPHTFRLSRIATPLEARAYENMTPDQWEQSFLKFDKNYPRDWDSSRGGLVENYREFEKYVEKKPDYFIPLIKKIILEQKVDHSYVIAGLNGLVKAKYSPETFALLYKQAMKLPLEEFNTRQMVWMAGYLSSNRLVDDEIFDFLYEIALQDPNPQKELNPSNPEFDTLNTNRGAAVHEIIKCFHTQSFSDKIFSAIEKVTSDPITSVKISALINLAVLMNIDKEKTLNIFLSLTANTDNIHIFKHSVNTAQYLSNYNFTALQSYFKKAITIDEVRENIAIILAIAWLNDRPGSYDLLTEAWNLSDKAKAKMVDVAVANVFSTEKNVRNKCFMLYEMFLSEKSSSIVHAYSTSFLHLNPQTFTDFYPLLKKFSESEIAKKDPHYYYDYLIKCCKHYPKQCLDLINKYKFYDKPNAVSGPYYDGSEPVKIIIGAYNGLYEQSPINLKYVKHSLNLFDEVLKEPVFRSAAHQVLDAA